METLIALRAALEAGRISSEALVRAALDRARDPNGEGARVFISVNDGTLHQARLMDAARLAGKLPSPWAGIPVSVKDLFDVAGEVTRAGSRVLQQALPATVTAPAIQRLLDAGLIMIGRTNMTEFAFSGVGINPHYGTPRNPWDRAAERIPGGSSSGAAISVTDGMAAAAIGTDTGGSCRIPAALTGLTGWKPTAARIPRAGVYPLAASLDTVGVLAPGVSCCALLDDLMAGGAGSLPEAARPESLNLAVLAHYATEGMDPWVSAGYERALARLGNLGPRLTAIRLPGIEHLAELNARGGIAAAEAYAFHADQLHRFRADYDPRVGSRIEAGTRVSQAELARIRAAREEMINDFLQVMAPFDAVLAPTVPIVAPKLTDFEDDQEYVRLNRLLLRNPSLYNFLDACAISIPVHEPASPPVGLMLAAPGGKDTALFRTALALERLLGNTE